MDDLASHNSKGKEVSQTPDCAVCLQSCIQPVQLPCQHIFCFLCVKGVTYQNNKCPMCRKNIPSNYVKKPKLISTQPPPPPPPSSSSSEDIYQWFYKGQNGWWQYDDRTSMEIENAYARDEEQCEVLISGFQYIIDFEKNQQIRKGNPHLFRRIKRDLVTVEKKGVAGIYVKANKKHYDCKGSNKANQDAACGKGEDNSFLNKEVSSTDEKLDNLTNRKDSKKNECVIKTQVIFKDSKISMVFKVPGAGTVNKRSWDADVELPSTSSDVQYMHKKFRKQKGSTVNEMQ